MDAGTEEVVKSRLNGYRNRGREKTPVERLRDLFRAAVRIGDVGSQLPIKGRRGKPQAPRLRRKLLNQCRAARGVAESAGVEPARPAVAFAAR
jgi:hypothetical protein